MTKSIGTTGAAKATGRAATMEQMLRFMAADAAKLAKGK
jgi:hypothetical protein